MKKLVTTAITASLCLSVAGVPTISAAQELREVDWYTVNFIKWKSGKGDRAHEIIALFEKVDEALGRDDVTDFHMMTGEWNSIVAFKMRNGPASIAWKEDPDDVAWMAEFAKQNGGEEKAKALWAEFNDCILEEQRNVGHIDINE